MYVSADSVAYLKAPCTAEDTQSKFILPIVPVHARDLPADRRRAGFDNRDFQFDWQGAHCDGRCLARAPLPAYAIARVRVGQFRSGAEALWWEDVPVARQSPWRLAGAAAGARAGLYLPSIKVPYKRLRITPTGSPANRSRAR